LTAAGFCEQSAGMENAISGQAWARGTRAPWAGNLALALALLVGTLVNGCVTQPRLGSVAPRQGDEIVVAGQFVHTETPVVLWLDPGGYDAYRVERRFAKWSEADWDSSKAAVRDLESPNRFGLRRGALSEEEIDRVRGGGWDLPLLQRVVDQFVIHYDACGTSRRCFQVLHDFRGLSVHFLLDLDGTIYQTLDLKERAWHATSSNSRSIGIEIAHIGAYPSANATPLIDGYATDADGQTRIVIPDRLGPSGIRTPGYVGHPAQPDIIAGDLQGKTLYQFDFTPEQYRALVKLTATLCQVFPRLRCDYPRDASGALVRRKLPDTELEQYRGLLGHFHIQTNKVDPGPAFQWDYLVDRARRRMHDQPQAGATLLTSFPARLKR
jgi:N-acetylmuramoyl-L-alanine amidase